MAFHRKDTFWDNKKKKNDPVEQRGNGFEDRITLVSNVFPLSLVFGRLGRFLSLRLVVCMRYHAPSLWVFYLPRSYFLGF